MVDDPEEDGTEYELVNNLTIPTDAGGNVGSYELGTEQAEFPPGLTLVISSVDGKVVAMPSPLDGWEEVIPLNSDENDLLEGG